MPKLPERRYKLYNDDCFNVFPKIEEGSVDMILTDPPYGIDYQSNRQGIDRKKSNRREGDTVVRASYFGKINNDAALPTDWLDSLNGIAKPDFSLLVFCHWSKWGELEREVSRRGFKVKNMVVMNKSNWGMGDLKGSFAPKHELLLFATKGRPIFRNGRKPDVFDAKVLFSGAKRLHPNQKPESWLLPLIEDLTDEGGLVVDPFMGSGTTGVACGNLNRKFIGCDNDVEHGYFEIAKRRIEEAYAKRK